MHTAAVWCATALALLGHALLWTGAVNRLHGLKGPRRAIKGLTILCVALFVGLPCAAIWWLWNRASIDANIFAAGGWLGPYVGVCSVIGAIGIVVKPWIERLRYNRSTLVEWTAEDRNVVKAVGGKHAHGILSKALALVPGNEAFDLSIDRKRLALARLPAELEGLTIAHISDLHMTGRVGPEFYDYAMRAVNDLRPDVIAITGDLVENQACWPWLAASAGRLCAPLGVYFVLGNHDYFIDADRTRAMLIDAGMTYLGGRWVRAEWNGVPVQLGGNEMPWEPAARLEQLAPRPARGGDFRIALCHTPDQFGWCERADVDLALAGHTHGGQVQLPVLGVIGSPSIFGTRYACGVFRRRQTVLHVTRGLGGLTPWRWRCPPEIALLELVREQPSA